MHADWTTGQREAKGFVRTAFERISDFLEALGNALRGNGFQSAADIFRRIGRGEVGSRRPGQGFGGEQAALSQGSDPQIEKAATLKKRLRDATGSALARKAATEFVNRPLTNEETGLVATVSGTTLSKMLSSSAWRNSASSQAHMLAVANVDHLFEIATRDETHPGRAERGDIRAIHRFSAPLPIGEDVLRVRMLVKEFEQPEKGARIYTLTAVEIEKSDAGVVGQDPVSGQFRREGEPSTSQPPPGAEARVDRGDSIVPEGRTRLPTPPAGFTDRFWQLVEAVKSEEGTFHYDLTWDTVGRPEAEGDVGSASISPAFEDTHGNINIVQYWCS